jgi:uncharacterized protein YndB with AHSA1/START domain
MENATGVSLEIEKTFGVPVERLYQAWTTESDLRQWWRPMENILKQMTNELQEGGQVSYEFENSQQQHAFTIHGKYKEVQEGKHLVYTWNWDLPTQAVKESEHLLTVSFESTDSGSRLHIRQDQFADEESVHPHKQGWENALESLRSHVEKQ